MTQPALTGKISVVQNCLSWFKIQFKQNTLSLIEAQFPNYAIPGEIRSVQESWEYVHQLVDAAPAAELDLAGFLEQKIAGERNHREHFKQMILRYRRHRAAETEVHREKTFHTGLLQTVEEDLNTLDALVATDWFQKIEPLRLPRAKDFLLLQFLEEATEQIQLAKRQYDEKFHILQAPALFLQDLAYLRAKCEMRDAPIVVAFLDIDDFKRFNSQYSETQVDRNLLPRFMQTLEAHVYQHGFAYRQGGDEYLVLLPSLSKAIAVAFLDELRRKLSSLKYPVIDGATTVSIGCCVADPDCPLTDRELRDRANLAKEFAKRQGKNRIATYEGSRLVQDELRIVSPADIPSPPGGKASE